MVADLGASVAVPSRRAYRGRRKRRGAAPISRIVASAPDTRSPTVHQPSSAIPVPFGAGASPVSVDVVSEREQRAQNASRLESAIGLEADSRPSLPAPRLPASTSPTLAPKPHPGLLAAWPALRGAVPGCSTVALGSTSTAAITASAGIISPHVAPGTTRTVTRPSGLPQREPALQRALCFANVDEKGETSFARLRRTNVLAAP